MGCCDKPFSFDIGRRSLLKGGAALAGALTTGGAAPARAADGTAVKLAFCSQLLCIVPYEVARAGGFFRAQGLEVELVYVRGGTAAMQALVGGAVDYAATSLDVALQAYGRGAQIRRFASTGRLPLFAVATAPQRAQEITTLKDLEGRTVGVSALGNADHALLLYLMRKAGADPGKVAFATLGPNILEALRRGQIDAGLIQEPALTLVRAAGGRVLVNAMDSADAERYLGGPYEFMGVAVRASEIVQRRAQMVALAQALQAALEHLQTMTPEALVAALPSELTAGGERNEMRDIIARYRAALYPARVAIDLAAAGRVAESLKVAGLLRPDADTSGLYDTTIVGG